MAARAGRLSMCCPCFADKKQIHGSATIITSQIVKAAALAGTAPTDDFNGAEQEGAGWYQVTADDGQRQSAAHCFLKPELDRENLTVLTGHLVCRLDIQNGRAVGVVGRWPMG